MPLSALDERRGGVVLVRARGLEIVADPTYLISLIALTAFVGVPVMSHVSAERGLPHIAGATALALVSSACIVAHELAHTVVARILGHRVRRITLFSLGGVSHVEGAARAPGAEYLVALAGPLLSLVLASPLLLASRFIAPSPWEAILGGLGLVNFFLGAFNLIPAFPMDGGRILRSGLWAALRDRARATRAAAIVGRVFAVGLMGLGVITVVSQITTDGNALSGAWQIMLGTFLFSAAGDEARA